MTDLSSELSSLLTARSCKSTIGRTHYSFDRVDEFVKEAYTIHKRTTELLSYLRNIRRPYLSTAPPLRSTNPTPSRPHRRSSSVKPDIHLTNTQRDAIDAEAKTTHRDISAAIARLSQAEKIRADTETALIQQKRRRRGFTAFGAWASGDSGADEGKNAEEEDEDGKVKGLRAVREAVLWFLGKEVEECGKVQGGMMEVRIRREIEKNKGVLAKVDERHKLPTPVSGQSSQDLPPGSADAVIGPNQGETQELSQDQLQLFASENNVLLKHYEDRLTQIRAAESSLLEISSLQSELAFNLSHQSDTIDQLVSESLTTTENVAEGNEELKRASERKRWAEMAYKATLVACGVCVTWDLLI